MGVLTLSLIVSDKSNDMLTQRPGSSWIEFDLKIVFVFVSPTQFLL